MPAKHRKPPIRDVLKKGTGTHRKRRFTAAPGVLTVTVPVAAIFAAPSISINLQYLLMAVLTIAATIALIMGCMDNVWRVYTRRHPEAAESMRFPEPVKLGEEQLTFAVLVPALNEESVIRNTASLHAQQDHGRSRTYVSLQDHDHATHREVAPVAAQHPDRIRVISATYQGKTMKADQLNTAIRHLDADVDVVGIGDAETLFPPTLLRHIEALFRKTGADVVQGGVMLTNLGRTLKQWWQVHNCMEYFSWFSSRMHFQADNGYMPYGGNTIFIRRTALEAAGGYPRHRTEDCKLGTDMAVAGVKAVAAYDPALCTQEHTPPKVWGQGGWFGQRVRWDYGFLKVLLEGKWRQLPTRKQRFLAWYFLATPFTQAFSGLVLPLAVATFILLKAPVGLVMYLYLPYLPILLSMTLQLVGLREFSRTFQQKALLRHYVSLVVGSFFYQVMLMMAAMKAVWEYATDQDVGWGSKTERISDPSQVSGFQHVPALEAS